MTPRITVSLTQKGVFEIHVNEAGRDLLVAELQHLSRQSDHFSLDYFGPGTEDQAEVPLRSIAYSPTDRVLPNGKVLFRPDDWDAEYYPHVMTNEPTP